MARARLTLGLVGPAALLFAGGGACGIADGPTRGFGSRQVLAIGDGPPNLVGFTEDESKVYLARNLEPLTDLRYPPPYDLSTLDLATGEIQLIAPAVIRTTWLEGDSFPSGLSAGRSLAVLHYPSAGDVPANFTSFSGPKPGHLRLEIVHEGTGRRVNITDVSDRNPILFGPSAGAPLAVDRFENNGSVRVWYGTPEALHRGPALFASGVLGFDASGAFGLNGLPGFGNPSITHAQFGDGSETTVVPPALGEHIMVPDERGAEIPPDPASGGPFRPWYGCVPATAPPGGSRCFFVYVRPPPTIDGTSRLVARATDDSREIVLPGALDAIDAAASAGGLLWTAISNSGRRLFSWKFGAPVVGGCVVAAGAIRILSWTRARDRFAAYIVATDLEGRSLPGTLVLGIPGGSCRVISREGIRPTFWRFSPDGMVLAWHELGAGGGTTIHLIATDSGEERRIDLPAQSYSSEFHGDHRLLVQRVSADGIGLSLIDFGSDPIREQVIADRLALAEKWVWIDDVWLLIGDALSRQDETFILRAVNTETGASRLISPSVIGFVTPENVLPPGASALPVVYVVRGRVPSPQDGIWLAKLERDQFGP